MSLDQNAVHVVSKPAMKGEGRGGGTFASMQMPSKTTKKKDLMMIYFLWLR